MSKVNVTCSVTGKNINPWLSGKPIVCTSVSIWGRAFNWSAVRYGIATACVMITAHAIAADASGPTTQESATGLEEIVVTAERREEKLDKVPISVTAFSQKTMDDLQIKSFTDLAAVTPGLVFSVPTAGVQDSSDVAIRGIFSGGNAPTTQFYVDETPVAIRVILNAPSDSPHPLIFDLDRVEVLRGPQGTLFGSSAMGGAIRYITPQPNLNDTSGYAKADVSYTDRGEPSYEIGAAYGAPIVTGTAGFRVSAWYQYAGGYIDKEDPYTGEILKRNANVADAYVIRPAFTWAPLEGLTITPAVFVQHFHSENSNAYWLDFLPYQESARAHVSGYIPDPSSDDLRVPSLAIKYDLAGLSFQSDTSYLDRDGHTINDYTHATQYLYGGNPFLPGLSPSYRNSLDDQTYTRAWQQEFRLSSQDPSSKVVWVAGLYYRHADEYLEQCTPGSLDPVTEAIAGQNTLEFTGFENYTLSDGQVCNAYLDYHTTDISEAAFGNITVNVTSHLKADAGVRVEHAVVEHQSQLTAGPLNGTTYNYKVLPDQVANPVTPRYSLTYQFNDNDMMYVSAAKGYRAGGGNPILTNPVCDPSLKALGLTSAPGSFNSDSLWSYEIGTKDSLFDRRLAIEASAFLIDWANIQTQVFLPSCSFAFTTNRGKAVSQGFDLQVAAIPVDGVKLGVNVGYTDAYFPNAAFGAPNSSGMVPLLNAAGDKLINVLPWTVAANVEYSRDISPLWASTRAYFRVDYRWLSAANGLNPAVANFDPEQSPYPNPAYDILNLRLGVIHGGLDLSAYVNNVTHSDPALGYAHDATGDPMFYANAIRPMTIGLTAYYRH
jgi:iron complex outermembrane receptor protein